MYRLTTRGCGAKQIHFTDKIPSAISHIMFKGWHFNNLGFRLEVHIHRKDAKDLSLLKGMIDSNLHYRPDVLLKFMPEDSGIVIKPHTDDGQLFGLWARRVGKDVRRASDTGEEELKRHKDVTHWLGKRQK
jgi:hypothetical protein